MATVINGTNMVVSVDESTSPSTGGLTAIAAATNCSCAITIDAGEITDKSSGDRKEFIGISSSWTIDAEAFYTDGSSDGETIRPSTLFDALDGGYRIALKFYTATGQTGAVKYTGYGYITSVSINAAVAEWSSYSVSVQGDGQLTKAAV